MAVATVAVLSLIVPLASAEGVGGYHYKGKVWADGELPAQPVVDGHAVTAAEGSARAVIPKGARAQRAYEPQMPKWPAASTDSVVLAPLSGARASTSGADTSKSRTGVAAATSPKRAGNSPVWVSSVPAHAATKPFKSAAGAETTAPPPPSSVTVKTAGRRAAQAANVDGLLVGLARSDGRNDPGQVQVALDYSAIAQAYGGGWGSRLHLVTMPGCALTTPQVSACQVQTPLAATNDTTAQKLTAAVTLPTGNRVSTLKSKASGIVGPAVAPMSVAVAAVAGTGGSQGDYTATSLSASGSWTQSASGAFTYSYPVATPPALGGGAPSVALSYNSQSIDGETSARNSQSSWIGDGWSYSPGFLERSYKPCR
ncbi:hypothetical protein AB0G17_06250, partial [Streptomyces sp. NPDC023838]